LFMLSLDSRQKIHTLERYGDPEVSENGPQQFESAF
jgi:hypothetical protein